MEFLDGVTLTHRIAGKTVETDIGLGDKEKALALLEKAYADPSMALTFLPADQEFDSQHSDPRHTDLLQRMGVPK
jgi:hypothetical protein